MYDFLSVGEMLIDFIPVPSEEGIVYQQNPGGSPANLACALARLGVRAAFAGKVGNDPFGHSCREALERSGESVNVKATTTEGMGFEGEGQGISAQAAVLIEKKGCFL